MLKSADDSELLKTFVENFTPQMFCCGYDHQGEDQKVTFDSWKGIQQHYRLYHNVSIYLKKPWNSAIPKYRVIEIEKEKLESGREKKRKRSIRKSVSDKLDVLDSSVEVEEKKFQTFLQSISLLAKVTDNSDLLLENIGKVLQDEDEDFIIRTIQPMSTTKLDEYQVKISYYERDIEKLKCNYGTLNEEQNAMLQKIPKMDRKEIMERIEFTKLYLSHLELNQNIFKNPEYNALLALKHFSI